TQSRRRFRTRPTSPTSGTTWRTRAGAWESCIPSRRRPSVTFKYSRPTGLGTRHDHTSSKTRLPTAREAALMLLVAQLFHGGVEQSLKSQILLVDPLSGVR